MRVTTLLVRAQEFGAIRGDVRPDEVYALLVGTTRAVEQLADVGPSSHSVVRIVLDGLRA
jgi:hypothetical protein